MTAKPADNLAPQSQATGAGPGATGRAADPDWHWSAAAAAAAPLQPGRSSALVYAHGSMSLRWYAPRGEDRQTPHEQDELYLVAQGHATFRRGDDSVAVRPGDALFVPAGLEHRFVDFSDDFATWVVFYGPNGGEMGVGEELDSLLDDADPPG